MPGETHSGLNIMAKREYEAAIFAAFLKLKPDFCDEAIVEWKQPADEKDFPDITCTTKSKTKVGVEIGEWLNEEQLTRAEGMERTQEALLKAIGPQGENNTDNVYFVWLHQPPRARMRSDDVEKLREELRKLITETDKQWPSS